MKDFGSILVQHWQRYPLMDKADFVKLAYQSEFGAGHFLCAPEEAWFRLVDEYTVCQRRALPVQHPPLFEELGERYSRVNLRALPRSGISLSTVARWFIRSAQGALADKTGLMEKLQLLFQLSKAGTIGISPAELGQFIAEYKKAGCPALHHSERYREVYQPAYRVVRREFTVFAKVFAAIDVLLDREPQVLVAIDGNSGAGKSYLAGLLAEIYDCNVFRMDDFFLPTALKTPRRLEEPGGNVHYERFAAEVLQGLESRRPFTYGVFDCRKQAVTHTVKVVPKRLNIIEGSYSMHPAFGQPYHLKVFLRVTGEKQRSRIRTRSGEALLARFVEEWIPLENRYFQAFGIVERADLVYHT